MVSIDKKYNQIKPVNALKEKNNEVSEEKVEVRQITQATKVKRGLFQRTIHAMLGPNGLPGIGRYLGSQVILPAVKDVIVGAVESGIRMAVYGEEGNRYQGRGRASYSRDYTRYSKYDVKTVSPSRKYHVSEYELDTSDEAVEVLDELLDYARKYEFASVAEYYSLIGVPTQFTDHDYGWTFDQLVRDARVINTGGKWMLQLPKLVELK